MTKHPLFWKEWKSAKWWSMLIMGIFLMMFLAINNELQSIQEMIGGALGYMSGSYMENIIIFERLFSNSLSVVTMVLIPLVIVISSMLFQSDRKENIGSFVSSLPFTKKEQFKVKWFVGLLTITIPFAITGLLIIVIRAVNWSWIKEKYLLSAFGNQVMTYDTLAAVLLTLLQVYLFLIAFYSFLMLIQTLIGKNIVASIIGVIVLAVPWFLIEAGTTTVACMLNKPFILRKIQEHSDWSLFYKSMIPRRVYIEIDETLMAGLRTAVFSYDYYWLKIAVLIVMIGLSLYVGIEAYARNENSRNGELVMFDWVGKTLVIGFTICMALLGNSTLRKLFINGTNPVYELATLTISTVIGYMIIKKVLNISRRCKYD